MESFRLIRTREDSTKLDPHDVYLLPGELTALVVGFPVGLLVGGLVIGCRRYRTVSMKFSEMRGNTSHTVPELLINYVSPFSTASRWWDGMKAARSGGTWSPQQSVCRLEQTWSPQQKRSATRSVRLLGRPWRRPWATSCKARWGTRSSSALSRPRRSKARRMIFVRVHCFPRQLVRHVAPPRLRRPWRALRCLLPRRRSLRTRPVI